MDSGQIAGPGLDDSPAAATATPPANEPGDGDLFGRTVGNATRDVGRPITESLGLARPDLARLIARYLPGLQAALDTLPADAGPGEDALEEPDVRAYLLECRAGRDENVEAWWAAILARRSLQPNHLWQDMGFRDRGELGLMLRRHFPELVRRNDRDMKWKKFLYRELCRREGMVVCKSPVCERCSDFSDCFGGEAGEPLQALAAVSRPMG